MVPERQYPMHTLDQTRRSLFLASYHHRQGLLSYQGWLAVQEKLILASSIYKAEQVGNSNDDATYPGNYEYNHHCRRHGRRRTNPSCYHSRSLTARRKNQSWIHLENSPKSR